MSKITYKHVIVAIISTFVLTIFINIGANKKFLFNRTIKNWSKMKPLLIVDDSTKRVARWGAPYYAALQIKQICIDSNIKNPIFLLEPNSYYKSLKMDYKSLEPITFYYFSGHKAIWMNSENVYHATHLVKVNKQTLQLQPITDSNQISKILEEYKRYEITL